MKRVHVRRTFSATPDVQQHHVGRGVEGAVEESKEESIATHGVEGGVEGEKEGRNAVAETADEKKQVCL